VVGGGGRPAVGGLRVVLGEVGAAVGGGGRPGQVAGHQALAEGRPHAGGQQAAGADGGQDDPGDQGEREGELDEQRAQRGALVPIGLNA
jgi:hypothetical protein